LPGRANELKTGWHLYVRCPAVLERNARAVTALKLRPGVSQADCGSIDLRRPGAGGGHVSTRVHRGHAAVTGAPAHSVGPVVREILAIAVHFIIIRGQLGGPPRQEACAWRVYFDVAVTRRAGTRTAVVAGTHACMTCDHQESSHDRDVVQANPTDAAIGGGGGNFVLPEIGKLGIAQLADVDRSRLVRL
jgi:hypothetical protein